ncbi:MAG TPA: FtsX-like permease family protein [Chitinophagaceae bacterium]|nr:FtsX-like permease family protein [Chitinophagaceae bacterium]
MNAFTLHITLYDLFFFGMIFVGLTFALLLAFVRTANRSANRFLAFALVAMILWMARVLAIDIRLNTYLPHWDWLPMQFLLALGPLLYFYVLRITRPQYKFCGKDLLHFAPVVLEQVMQAFQQLNPLLQLLIFISVITYLRQSYKLILQFYTRQPIVMMDRSRLEFRWLRRLLAVTALLWCLWLALAIIHYVGYHNQPGMQLYYPFYILFAVIIIWFAAAAFLKPQAAVMAQTPASAKPPVPAELRAKGTLLKRAMEANLYYQDPELSLNSLAEKLGMPPHELSRVINTALNKNFNDFINEYRVMDAARKIEDAAYNNITLLGIGFEAGFNSKTSFNRIFKQMTGKSPTEYKTQVKNKRPTYNLGRYARPALLILNREPLQKWNPVKLNSKYMFSIYVKIAWRNLIKNKLYSSLNVLGLAAGLGVCLLIILFVTDERSYDRYNVNADRIYRIDEDSYINNTQYDAVNVSKFFGPTLVASYPKIQQMVRFRNPGDLLVRQGKDHVLDHHFTFADSTIFKVFTLPMIAGDPNTALNSPHSIVIDESAARRYFKSTNVIGRALEVGDDNTPLKITGVIRDMPEQSQFHFSFIRPLRDCWTFNDPSDNDWLSSNYYTYILAQPGVTRAEIQKDVNEVVNRNIGPALQELVHSSVADLEKAGNHFRYRIFPLTDVHLHSNKSYEIEANGNIQFVYIFSVIAVLILLVACVNFMNLSTARSANRAKEVGIRKVAGSTKGHLILQFLTESVLLSFFSLVLALGIAALLLPVFNQLTGKSLQAGILFSGRFLLILVLLVLLVGCAAGSYPAFYLSSFQPIHVLKGKMAVGFKSSWLRSSLVVFQFFISIGLIVSTLVIYRQLHYIRNKEVGFNRDQVLVIHNTWALGKEGTANLRQNLLTLAGVTEGTITSDLPTVGGDQYRQPGWFRDASFDARKAIFMTTLKVDDHYVPTLGMQIVKGRDFNLAQFPTDSTAIILNEAAVATLGVKDPLNLLLYNRADELKSDPSDHFKPLAFHVIGVVKDFNYNSMHDKIHPLVMMVNMFNSGSMAFRFHTNDVPGLVRQVESKFHAAKPGLPFSYSFMDDDFDKLYHGEQQTGQVFITFAVFAILIACLGLFGLVTYAAEQRTKEIGIRKVLGASVSGIVSLLGRDFARLVGIAAFIAFPIAWWAMYKWLGTFAYRTQISWWIFLVAGALALAIALLTVSIQTIRAALANPVKSLRSE